MQSIQTGYRAARRVFEEPAETPTQRKQADLALAYTLLWSYYNNSLFDKGSASLMLWMAYKSTYTLYRNIRLIYNPTRRLVDFYAGIVYPGVLTTTPDLLPDGVPNACPFKKETPQPLLDAVGQFWQWSNWQSKKSVEVRYGAALGSVLVEIIDDLDRGKVAASIVWPGYLADLELDPAGNVKEYALEYLVRDEDGSTYTYRKEVDKLSFRTYRNEQLEREDVNAYGFVPAVWIKHMDTGSDIGSPAVAGSLGKIDELNNLASHVHDQIHKVIGSPIAIFSSGTLRNLFSVEKRGATGATTDLSDPAGDKESVLMLSGPPDGHVDSLAGDLSLADSAIYMDKLMSELEADHPELTFYRELRAMSQVTGPAAERLVGDVASRVVEASANYDQQNVKLFQMAAAIGGYRANSGAWSLNGPLTPQQQKFLPFGLESYRAGDLDLTILPRPLLTPTRYEAALQQQAFWTGVKLAVDAGVPLELALRKEGWTEEELAQLGADRLKQIMQDQMLAQEDVIPRWDQQGNLTTHGTPPHPAPSPSDHHHQQQQGSPARSGRPVVGR